jgi:hypothetical protein
MITPLNNDLFRENYLLIIGGAISPGRKAGIVVVGGRNLKKVPAKRRVWFIEPNEEEAFTDFEMAFNSPWPGQTGRCISKLLSLLIFCFLRSRTQIHPCCYQ